MALRTLLSLAAIAGAAIGTQKPIGGPGAKSRDPFTPDFDDFLDGVLKDWKVAGASIAVVDGDKVYAKGYGYATLDPKVEATPETLWYVGSTTKAQLAATIAHFIDTKAYPEALYLGWQTPISSILRDDFVLEDEWATAHLTLEDAVSHRTGFPSHDRGALVSQTTEGENVIRTAVRNLRNLPGQGEPRTEFHYCNPMFLVLTHVVETLTGKPLAKTLRETLWDPLGMDSTFLYLDDAQSAKNLTLSRGYFWNEDRGKFRPMAFMPTHPVSGAGSAISSVLDYTKWVKALLTKSGPLSQAAHDDVRRPRFISAPAAPEKAVDATLYSLAWFRTLIHGEQVYWHSGSTMTHGTYVHWLPERAYAVIIMANYATLAREEILYKLFEERFAVPQDKRINVRDMNKNLWDTIRRNAANATKILYPDLPETPLPPSVPIGKLAGTYHDKGYGTIKLREEKTAQGERVLVADRDDFVWKYWLRLHHVSGDHWVMYTEHKDTPGEVFIFEKARFEMGVDGAPKALGVEFATDVGVDDGIVLFERLNDEEEEL